MKALLDNQIKTIAISRSLAPSSYCISTQNNLYTVNPTSITLPSFNDEISTIFVTTKCFDTLPALESIKHRLTQGTRIILFQNGLLESYDQVKKEFPDLRNIILASTTMGAYKKDNTVHHVATAGETIFGYPITSSKEVISADLEDILKTLKFLRPCVYSSSKSDLQSFHTQIVQKLVANCCINPITALKQVKNGFCLTDVESLSSFNTIIDEISLVLQKLEWADFPGLSNSELKDYVSRVCEITKENQSSMCVDMMYKRRTEIEYLNGYIIKKANEFGVQVPKNRELVEKIRLSE